MLNNMQPKRTPGHVRPMSVSVRPDIQPDITGFPPKGEPGMSGVPVRSGCPGRRIARAATILPARLASPGAATDDGAEVA